VLEDVGGAFPHGGANDPHSIVAQSTLAEVFVSEATFNKHVCCRASPCRSSAYSVRWTL
jgi:hypothetical protein